MNLRRTLLATTAVAVGSSALAGAALAQDQFTSVFEAFETMSAEAPPGAFEYGSANQLGEEGLELMDVSITSPEGDTITIDTLTVEQVELAAINEQRPPFYLTASIEGLSVPAAAVPDADLSALGVESIVVNADVAYLLDAEAMTFELGTAEVEMVDLGSLSLQLAMSNVAPTVADQPMAILGAALASASIAYDDAGLANLALQTAAEEEGSSVEALIQEAQMQLSGMSEMLSGQGAGEATIALLDGISAFLADLPEPDGVLTITAAPESPVPLAALASEEAMTQGADMLNATASYE